jgi:hypothetical protein
MLMSFGPKSMFSKPSTIFDVEMKKIFYYVYLHSASYWNVLGLDLKNEPWQATWGDGGATDFRLGATKIGNRMLAGCPQWYVRGLC